MRRNKRVRILAVILLLVLGICGCSGKEQEVVIEQMEAEEATTFGFDFLGGSDVMPISGYYGPWPQSWSRDGNIIYDYISDECFQNLSDAGINHLSYAPWNFNDSEEYSSLLMTLGEKYGVGITVNVNLGSINTLEKADETLAKYAKYPSMCSVFVIDEPSSKTYMGNQDRLIEKYVPYFEILNELGYFPYCNLFPLYDADQRDVYNDYLDEFLTTCKPPVLMYDHYVFDNRKPVNYFWNMSIIREKAEEHNIPWWGFIGAGTDWFNKQEKNLPTEYEVIWNVNTMLAYGAKGIQYYPVIQNIGEANANPDNPEDGFSRIGLIGVFGGKTRFWHYAKRVNEQIAAVDEVLMNSVNKGVLLTSQQAEADLKDAKYVLEGTSWRELTGVEGETMIGCFNYNGKSAFYVVNYSTEYAQNITLNFADAYKLAVTQNAETSYVEAGSLKLDMEAGEGVLIVVE